MSSRAIEYGLSRLGFKSIRENQRKVVEAYLAGKDVLVIAPTGSGKSLAFQIGPFVIDNFKHGDQQDIKTVCLVIAPLVSLMKDQVSFLRKKQINAVILGPESTEEENREAKLGRYNLIFASPEAIFGSHRSTILALKDKLEAVFVDEGHCIVKWGYGTGMENAFRKDYSRIAELRSILKRETPFIVLTATATQSTKDFIINELVMRDCVQLVTIPDKQNIRFSVSTVNPDDLASSFSWLINELRTKKCHAEKVLVFCRKKCLVKDLYEAFHEALGSDSYVLSSGDEPMDDRTRLFAMYHKKTHHLVKDVVEKEFCKLDGTVRVVFCTIAFGMGVDVQGAYLVIHFGPSSTIVDYIQECGRVGRTNERMSHAVLLKYSGCTKSKNIEKTMKYYINNTELCRRSLLMKPFLANGSMLDAPANEQPTMGQHMCCDVCAKNCRCLCSCEGACTCNVTCNSELHQSPMEKSSIMNNQVRSCSQCGSSNTDVKSNKINEEMVAHVRDELFQYRASLANDIPDAQLLTGIDIATGFSKILIEKIISNIWKITSFDSLKNIIPFFNEEHALQSWCIIRNAKGGLPLIEDTGGKNYEYVTPPTSDYTSDEESDSDNSGICRRKICTGIRDSDSDTD